MKVLTIQLNHADKEITELNSERALMKSCIADVNSLLSNIIETSDPLIPITVKKHLAEKLWPAFIVLNWLEGVSESMVLPQQGGETTKDQSMKEPTLKAVGTSLKAEPKDNVASASKGKESFMKNQ